jgi:hypothetical protein
MPTEPKPVYDFSDLKNWTEATDGLLPPARLLRKRRASDANLV